MVSRLKNTSIGTWAFHGKPNHDTHFRHAPAVAGATVLMPKKRQAEGGGRSPFQRQKIWRSSTSFVPFSCKSRSSPHHMSGRVAALMTEVPCKYQARSPLHWRHTNQCQMRCPFWLRDILLGVTDSLLESEALCVRNARLPLRQRQGIGPWHWRSGSAGRTVGAGS